MSNIHPPEPLSPAATPLAMVSAGAPVLAFSTSSAWCSVAVSWPDGGLDGSVATHRSSTDKLDGPRSGWQSACASEKVGNGHSMRLLPMAHELLEQAGLRLADVGLIAFDAGPGSFTGLRIGCGLAQGLALGLGCPVMPVVSLQALAWPHRQRFTISATDARMGEVYWALWAGDEAMTVASGLAGAGSVVLASHQKLDHHPVSVTGPEVLAAHIAHGLVDEYGRVPSAASWVATGDAFLRYPDLADTARAHGAYVQGDVFPRADVLADIALLARSQGLTLAADLAAPLYVRDKVALDVDEQQARRDAREAAR